MNLKQLRKINNKTQEEVAMALKCSRQNYSRYENESVEPNISTLIELANYFNVSLDYLCGRQYNNQVGYIPDDKKEVVKLVLQLEGRQLDKAEAYLTALIDAGDEIKREIK